MKRPITIKNSYNIIRTQFTKKYSNILLLYTLLNGKYVFYDQLFYRVKWLLDETKIIDYSK